MAGKPGPSIVSPGYGDKEGNLPDWFHRGGAKMKLMENTSREPDKLLFGNSTNFLQIDKPSVDDGKYYVSWVGIHTSIDATEGHIWMDKDTLMAAFGIINKANSSGYAMLKRYNGTCCEPGVYFRLNNFLNIYSSFN